jgi:hypothetical protein
MAKGGSTTLLPTQVTGLTDFQGFNGISGTIESTHSEAMIVFQGTTAGRTITLPANAVCKKVTFRNLSTQPVTVASGAGSTGIYDNNVDYVTSLVILSGELAIFENCGSLLWSRSNQSHARGSFTASLTGCTTSPTATWYWQKTGNVVTLSLHQLYGESNLNTLTFTGIPDEIKPPQRKNVVISGLYDASQRIETPQNAYIEPAVDGGDLVMMLDNSETEFTQVGIKGFYGFESTAITYTLDGTVPA